MILLLIALFFIGFVTGRSGVGPGEQDWGYVTVRPEAHIFYWLYYHERTTEHPLVIWLQGGPGASSTGYGNFEELGIVDTNLNVRNYSWVKHVNVLFIDNPVGTGFSYVDSYSALTTNNSQIAKDLVTFTGGFLEAHPEFKTVPLYIFSESYGGKMAAEYALFLDKAIKDGNIEVPLEGVALGDSWVSPIDSVLTWAPFLLQMGFVDTEGYNIIDSYAQQTKAAIDAGKYELATDLWGRTEMIILQVTGGIDFYNVLFPVHSSSKSRPITSFRGLVNKLLLRDDDDLDHFMNTVVKEALEIPAEVTWGGQSGDVFDYLSEDFMKPATEVVEQLLEKTDLTVCVFTGQLDLIVDTPGTLLWAEQLKWSEAKNWATATRSPVVINGIIEGYKKSFGNFHFYWLLRSGHMVPTDNPTGALKLLQEITHYK
ncbi:retinoid-inducible serine carboxypeptidase-like isoform X2 [Zootermopsis nevadensis]|uniref:retinoid-inducible serine carboxypeptidase-like isoform X2 n=1 Tax=Zootermopsis nevadensis TaxID=136037 RepID=UPI000B8E46B2|nr:retinoid-inducible serine carboxypeptidase-like isoform X2 [Zootermopsis nevadensis]